MTHARNHPPSITKRRPVNVTIQATLLAEAKALGVNISQVADVAVAQAVRHERKRRFIEENKEAIAGHHAWVEKHGVLISPIWMDDDAAL